MNCNALIFVRTIEVLGSIEKQELVTILPIKQTIFIQSLLCCKASIGLSIIYMNIGIFGRKQNRRNHNSLCAI